MQRKLTIALVTALSFGAVGFTAKHRTDCAWASMQERLDELEAARLARSTERDALWGETTEGRAWEHYQRALDEVRALGDVRERVEVAAVATTDEQRRDRDELLVLAADALAHLRRGAHARDAASAVNFLDGTGARVLRLTDSRTLSQLACAQFLALHEQGKSIEGLHAVLDAQQLARDMMSSAVLIEEMIGIDSVVPHGMQDFLATRGDELSTEAKEFWLDALDRLAKSISAESQAIVSEIEMMGRELSNHAGGSTTWLPATSIEAGWRYGFSWRQAAADYVQRGAEQADEITGAYGLDPVELMRRLREQSVAAAGDPNPFMSTAFPKFMSCAYSRLWGRAKLSYLRHALALDLGRVPCEPLDAFGRGVDVEVTADRIQVETVTEESNPNRLAIVLTTH